jgi:hypothetical protein
MLFFFRIFSFFFSSLFRETRRKTKWNAESWASPKQKKGRDRERKRLADRWVVVDMKERKEKQRKSNASLSESVCTSLSLSLCVCLVSDGLTAPCFSLYILSLSLSYTTSQWDPRFGVLHVALRDLRARRESLSGVFN